MPAVSQLHTSNGRIPLTKDPKENGYKPLPPQGVYTEIPLGKKDASRRHVTSPIARTLVAQGAAARLSPWALGHLPVCHSRSWLCFVSPSVITRSVANAGSPTRRRCCARWGAGEGSAVV